MSIGQIIDWKNVSSGLMFIKTKIPTFFWTLNSFFSLAVRFQWFTGYRIKITFIICRYTKDWVQELISISSDRLTFSLISILEFNIFLPKCSTIVFFWICAYCALPALTIKLKRFIINKFNFFRKMFSSL